jgi:HSP20 family molecular chaperone IbpA
MADLATRDNVRENSLDFRSNFDQILSHLLSGSTSSAQQERKLIAAPPIEVWVDKEHKTYHLNIAIPGVNLNDVQLHLQGNNLSVTGEHKSEAEKKGADYLQREYSYERFRRTITLPDGLDLEKLTAQYKNGVLEVSAPFSSAAQPKRIEIQSQPKAQGAGA